MPNLVPTYTPETRRERLTRKRAAILFDIKVLRQQLIIKLADLLAVETNLKDPSLDEIELLTGPRFSVYWSIPPTETATMTNGESAIDGIDMLSMMAQAFATKDSKAVFDTVDTIRVKYPDPIARQVAFDAAETLLHSLRNVLK